MPNPAPLRKHVPGGGCGKCHWVKAQVLTLQFPDSYLELTSHHADMGQLRDNAALALTVSPECERMNCVPQHPCLYHGIRKL